MIVVDSSAVLAIALAEPEALEFAGCLQRDRDARLSTVNYVEASNVLEGRLGAIGRALFENTIEQLTTAGLLVVAFDPAMAQIAREGFRRYGKGRHPAGLNLGDCFAYSLAKLLDAPLLFKGDDFARTDVKRI